MALLLKDTMPTTNKELLARIASLECQLSADDAANAGAIRAAWFTGKTPLTVKAQAGMNAVSALITSLNG